MEDGSSAAPLRDCQSGWLLVEKDLSGSLTKEEDLMYGEREGPTLAPPGSVQLL